MVKKKPATVGKLKIEYVPIDKEHRDVQFLPFEPPKKRPFAMKYI